MLVDWVDGGRRFQLDGQISDSRVRYAFPFDAAIALPGSEFAVLYARAGTKGLILRDGAVVREINRSFYCANAYEYPVAVSRLKSGRAVLMHCPDEYCRLEIEDLASGERLTASNARQPADFFHSRLATSPDGRYLISAGWVWHPFDSVKVFDVEAAIAMPSHLDGEGLAGGHLWADESSAAFLSRHRMGVALRGWEEEEDGPQEATRLHVIDLHQPDQSALVETSSRLGALMPVGSRHVLALYGHPRLIDIESGKELQSWPHLKTGSRTSSILAGGVDEPPMALDAKGGRIAIADAEGVSVLQFRLRG